MKIPEHKIVATKEITALPNGCTLYMKENEAGGRTYFSNEIGGGVTIWDTCLVDESTLLAAIVYEMTLRKKEAIQRRNNANL